MKPVVYITGLLILVATSCTTLTLKPANFAWPIEAVLVPDESGNVSIERYSTEFNTGVLFQNELNDSTNYSDKQLRVIRDEKGFYFMTAEGFKNVYVFKVDDGTFILFNKINVGEKGLSQPAFNQRKPYIELLNGDNSILLDSKGVKRG